MHLVKKKLGRSKKIYLFSLFLIVVVNFNCQALYPCIGQILKDPIQNTETTKRLQTILNPKFTVLILLPHRKV